MYVDLQVNGYAGIDFNGDNLTADSLHEACSLLKQDGVVGFLPTVITDDIDKMCGRLQRLAELREQDSLAKEIVLGFHIEGPFISSVPGFIGAHPAEAACDADPEKMQRLLDASAGLVRIVTLAPERDTRFKVTRLLADQDICVSAGHCDPTLDQLDGAIDAGLSMFTHLGNGCPLNLHRHDNIIQRVLSRADRLWCCLIADGFHVPWHALGNYLAAAGVDRCLVVTDCISAARMGPGTYRLGGQDVIVDEGGQTWSADRSHLAGSTVTMSTTATNLRDRLGCNSEDVARLIFENPLRAIGMSTK